MSTPIQSIKLLIALQIGIGTLLGTSIFIFGEPQLAASFMVGVALMSLNLILLIWSWWRILTQKTIAWTIIVIVIKYSSLLGAMYYLARTKWFDSLGAGLGISSFIAAALGLAFLEDGKKKEKK